MRFGGQKPRLTKTKTKKGEDCTPKAVAAFRHHTHQAYRKRRQTPRKPDDRPELRNNFQLSNYTPKQFPINDITPGDIFQLITLHPEI